jgi:putative nucleotidyltransferase with HDIG domain
MGARSLRFPAFVGVVTLAALLATWASWSVGRPVVPVWLFLTLAVGVLVSEVLAVELPNGASISLTYPLFVCAVVLVGPAMAALLAAISMIPTLLQRPRPSVGRMIFNLSQLVLTVVITGWLYRAMGGHLLTEGALGRQNIGYMAGPLVLAPAVGIVINGTLFGLGYAIMHGVSLRRVWDLMFSWAIPSQYALGLLGVAIAQVMIIESAQGFALFVIPLVVARQLHSRYLSLRDAYADTVRSLVAAIEAKDPYTKGHSVRVAKFAVVIARSMGMKDHEIERLEYAALLHDLGKIGISRAILSKPSVLSDEEYEKIREHPDIGARILESVPFLDDIRPVVQNHHERVDGAGYGHGLASADIPLAARILSVADSFDAMTAERPYRRALSAEDAVSELTMGSGSQFDSEIVDVLIRALPDIEDEALLSDAARAEGAIARA